MKRAYGALFATFLIFVMVGVSQRYVFLVTERLISGLDYSTQLFDVQEYGAVEELLRQLQDYYARHITFLNLLVRREYLAEIARSLKGLPAFCNADSPKDYAYTVLCLKEELASLQKLFFCWL